MSKRYRMAIRKQPDHEKYKSTKTSSTVKAIVEHYFDAVYMEGDSA